MNTKSLFAVAAILTLGILASGIATPTRAAKGTTAIETVVATDFRTTWDVLVAELSESDFAVNATIKENSTIRVLLQSKTPSTWVDCGSISVNSQHKVFGDRSYDFLAANSVRYLVADEEVDELVDVERRTTLNALASIKLTPAQHGTLVNVDAHYVMKIRTREFGRNITPRSLDSSMDFDSADQATATEEIRQGATIKTVTVDCRPTGELERRIVSVLERPHAVMAAKANRRLSAEQRTTVTVSPKLPPQTVVAASRPSDERRASVSAPQKTPSQTVVAAPQLPQAPRARESTPQKLPSKTVVTASRLPEEPRAKVITPPPTPSPTVVTAECSAGHVKDLLQNDCVPKLSTPEIPVPDKTVQRAQKRLAELGYEPGPADGVYGPKTRQAIQQYQESIGVPATGRVDEILLAQSANSAEAARASQTAAHAAEQPRNKVSPLNIIAFLSVPLPAFHGRTGFELLLAIVIVSAIALGSFGVLIQRRRRVGTA